MSAHIAPPPHHRLYYPRLCPGRHLVSPLPLCVTCTELLKWSSKDTISSSGSLLKHPVIPGEQPDLLRGPQSPSGHAACCHPGPNVPSLAACPHTLLSSDRLSPPACLRAPARAAPSDYVRPLPLLHQTLSPQRRSDIRFTAQMPRQYCRQPSPVPLPSRI